MPKDSPSRPRRLIAGNWKMNGSRADARLWARKAIAAAEGASAEVALFPSFTLLSDVASVLAEAPGRVLLGGQGCHGDANGAHTTGVSAQMLREAGCTHVLCGHSEVRLEYGFDDARVGKTVAAALAAGLTPILCLGESRTVRDAGKARSFLEGQVRGALAGVPGTRGIDVAYEPVWAIGAGKPASADEAREAHGWIAEALRLLGRERARILYGGSVSHGNVKGFLEQPGVDGVLVGGQSLDPAAFAAIVRASP